METVCLYHSSPTQPSHSGHIHPEHRLKGQSGRCDYLNCIKEYSSWSARTFVIALHLAEHGTQSVSGDQEGDITINSSKIATLRLPVAMVMSLNSVITLTTLVINIKQYRGFMAVQQSD